MKYFLKAFFRYSRREQRGIILLLVILLLLITFQQTIPYLIPEEKSDFSSLVLAANPLKKSVTLPKQKPTTAISYFSFDPNNISVEQWQQLGLSAKQAAVIDRYRKKGGRFYKKEDLRKMYCISEKNYRALEPFISIPNQSVLVKEQPSVKEKPVVLELNSIDSVALVSVPGIGPTFARRIIRFRALLRGFYTLEQLREVYGMDSLRFTGIAPHFTVNGSLIKSLDINAATEGELKSHPYIGYKLARIIVNYRKQHGVFEHLNDLEKLDVMESDRIERLRPYLQIAP